MICPSSRAKIAGPHEERATRTRPLVPTLVTTPPEKVDGFERKRDCQGDRKGRNRDENALDP
jgi:hypothetical protein